MSQLYAFASLNSCVETKLRMVETIMTQERLDLLTTASGLTSVEKFHGREAEIGRQATWIIDAPLHRKNDLQTFARLSDLDQNSSHH